MTKRIVNYSKDVGYSLREVFEGRVCLESDNRTRPQIFLPRYPLTFLASKVKIPPHGALPASPSTDISRIVSPLATYHGNVRQRESTGSRPSFTTDGLPTLSTQDLITWTLYLMYPMSGDFCFSEMTQGSNVHLGYVHWNCNA
ncbi:hypothetical protein ARMGADRAFT_729062 [Armillaria gallica]|uniref:Uncharacterized protein n=1 Tax=Armillaria gallica TaxID=47427 RepID=A0A2H3CU88_ARMGA|nr:hypothetical protein ARMGADRAFT_729062 [Armillaria gallica]